MKTPNFEGVKIIDIQYSTDMRGSFTKIYNKKNMVDRGIDMEIRESYYSVSNQDVIRGMHFQLPPHGHDKMVHIVSGAVEDVLLDLRKGSVTFVKCFSVLLHAEKPQVLYIPKGFAHGFKCLCDNTIMLYNVSSEYVPEKDAGILWSSIDYDWKIDMPIVSARDKGLINFSEFISPF